MENKIHNYDTQLDELLDCPFCGGKPSAHLIGNEHSKKRVIVIKCTRCFVERRVGAIYHETSWIEETAIKAWNNRVVSEQSIRADERGKCTFTDDELLLMKIWGMFVRDTEKDFTEDEFAVLEKLNKLCEKAE